MQIFPAVDIQQGRVARGIPGSGATDPTSCARRLRQSGAAVVQFTLREALAWAR